MDIDLFSEMVKGLILDNDGVTLPGLGTFVSEVMPSTFSDKGYTINPPYRRLSFRQRGSEEDRLLTEFYSKANGTDPETSMKIISEFISGLRSTLQTKKIVVFPGLGRLRATKENAFFFIADEDLDIYPYGVGLESVSLKTHEETPEEVAQGVAALRELVGDAAETVAEPFPSVAGPVEATGPADSVSSKESLRQAQRPEEEQRPEDSEDTHAADDKEVPREKNKRGWKVAAIVAASMIGVVLVAFGIFMLLAHVAPDFIDSILYTPEELRIINY